MFDKGAQRMEIPFFLRRIDAAAYVQSRYSVPCSRHWLAKLAVTGGGPPYRKAGKFPLYAPSDLDDWARSRIGRRQATTADTSAAESGR
jgi:hypothetical protein